jgi:hypothetical protein
VLGLVPAIAPRSAPPVTGRRRLAPPVLRPRVPAIVVSVVSAHEKTTPPAGDGFHFPV